MIEIDIALSCQDMRFAIILERIAVERREHTEL
jgi:hypothetical protein